MRTSSGLAPLLLLALAACGKGGGGAPQPPAEVPGAAVIGCALGPRAALAQACTVERTTTPAGIALVLRHPDGGFRRLIVTQDGRGVTAADGALPASVSVIGEHEIEVTIGDDRYRLPATLQSK